MVWTLEFWRSFKDRTAIFDGVEDDYPRLSHFIYPVMISVFITALRYIVERHLFGRLGETYGLRSEKIQVEKNDVLERAFISSSKNGIDSAWIRHLAKQVDWNERQVEKWIRLRKDQNQPTELIYFTECGWRFTYHTSLFIIGLTVLWDKPWLWRINECWTDLPHQTVSREVWWYYMIHMGIYISHIYNQLVHRQRNDFVEMFIHHLVTILLMTLSWTSNTVRIGTLVLVVHDCADIFMEAARIAKFLKFPRICSLCGVLFFLSWMVTRLGLFPFHILKNIWFDATVGIMDSPYFFALTVLLHVLFALHIFWSYFILKIIYTFLTTGKIVDDSRSFSAEISSEDENLVNSSRKKRH